MSYLHIPGQGSLAFSELRQDDIDGSDDIELQTRRNRNRSRSRSKSRNKSRSRSRSQRRHAGQDEDDYDDNDDEEEEEKDESSEDEQGMDVLYTKQDTKRIVRKFDRYLVSFLALLYMLSFLDRSNIGNAKIAGMMEDLDISSEGYEWLLTAFYITYILFEWMTLLWKLRLLLDHHTGVDSLTLKNLDSWGLIACLQGLAPNWASLLVARALLGISEAAFGPGVPFYLSFFYKREELAFRTGLFISAAPLSTAYAGSLAYLLTSLPTRLAPWRLLFIIEGWPSLVAALVAWWWIPDSPSDAWFLKGPEEKRIATLRLLTASQREQRQQALRNQSGKNIGSSLSEAKGGRLKWREVVLAVGDLKNWLTAFMFFSCNIAFSSLPIFLPTIINEMGNTRLQAQALSAPPYLVSFVVVITTSYLSDRFKSRSTFVIGHSLVGAFGYAVLASAPRIGLVDWRWRYAAVYLASSGIFSAIAIIIPWTVGNSESSEGRGTGVAILNLVGQCGPLVGTRLYPARDGPYYTKGMTICSFFMGVVCVLALSLRFMLQRENRKREEAYKRRVALEGEDSSTPSVNKIEKGFRFML